MAVEFKPGDIVTVPNGYTTALLIRMQPSVMRLGHSFGQVAPMFGIFPIGPYLYEAEFPDTWLLINNPTENVLIEAKRVLTEAWLFKTMDNLTYIEILAGLNERTEPQ